MAEFKLPSGIPLGEPIIGTEATGDTAAAVDFLMRMFPEGGWRLSQIGGGGAIESRTFAIQDAILARHWIEQGQGKVSQYFTVSVVKQGVDPGKKCAKEDVSEVVCLWVDVDPREGEEVVEARNRIATMFDQFSPRPSIVIFSGGGCQAFWLLAHRISVVKGVVRDRVETAIKALERCFGADACHNVDRLMRLPGTVNVPSVKKLARGRQRARAEILWAEWDRRYEPEDFREIVDRFRAVEEEKRAAPVEEVEVDWAALSDEPIELSELPVPDWVRGMIRTGSLDKPDGTTYRGRSEAMLGALVHLAAGGASVELMLRVVLDPGLEIGAHARAGTHGGVREYALRQVRRAREFASDPELAELNDQYALVLVGGKAAVMKEVVNEVGNRDIEFLAIEAFKAWLRPRKREVPGEKKPVPLAEIWLSSRRRRSYEGVTFKPEVLTGSYYNLWRGWPVQAREGTGHELFLDHLEKNIAGGVVEHARWIIAWLAQIFQQPSTKMGTSLVIRGEQGVGKTKVGEVLRQLLGPHYRLVSSPRLVTGNFNAHMRGLLLLHADEGFWAGDREAEGKLKDLITGTEHAIELKGKDAFWVPNLLRLFVTGNPDWLVPAGMHERRFAVFEAGKGRMEDHEYFRAIDEGMESGGREALLWYMTNIDIGGVDLRTVPKTSVLLEQKIAALTPEDAWWLDVLMEGKLPIRPVDVGHTLGIDVVLTKTLFEHYLGRTSQMGVKRRRAETEFGFYLKKAVPKLLKQRVRIHGNLEMIYRLPSLLECRAAFEVRLKQGIDWGEEGNWEEEIVELSRV